MLHVAIIIQLKKVKGIGGPVLAFANIKAPLKKKPVTGTIIIDLFFSYYHL
jgi:hypothetical protein